MSKNVFIGVIGLGKFGLSLGKALVNMGYEVLGVDRNEEAVSRAQSIFTQVYRADASDKKVLEQLGFKEVTHAIVSVGSSISTSSMVAFYLKELGVPNVWVKAINEDHEKLLLKIGADHVTIPERTAAHQLALRIALPGFLQMLPFGEKVVIQEKVVERWHNKTLKELDLANKYQIQVIAIKREGEPEYRFVPKGSDILKRGDVLVIIGEMENLLKVNS